MTPKRCAGGRPNGALRSDLGTSIIGTGVAFFISLLLTPVLTRIFRPEDYGAFALANNLAVFLAPAALCSLTNSIPLETDAHRRRRLVRSLVAVSHVTFLVVAIACAGWLFWRYLTLGRLSEPDLAISALPFLFLSIAWQRIAFGCANSQGDFSAIAGARIRHALVAKPLAIFTGMTLAPSGLVLALFETLGYMTQTSRMLPGSLRSLFIRRLRPMRLYLCNALKELGQRREISGFYNAVVLLGLGSIAAQIGIVLACFGSESAGHFSLGLTIGAIPIQVVSLGAAPVLYRRLIELSRKAPNRIPGFVFRGLAGWAAAGTAPYLILWGFGPELFGFVFGAEWSVSGSLASVLAPALFLAFTITPMLSLFRVLARVRIQFWVEVSYALLILIVFFGVSRQSELADAIAVLASIMVAYWLAAIGALLFVVRESGVSARAL